METHLSHLTAINYEKFLDRNALDLVVLPGPITSFVHLKISKIRGQDVFIRIRNLTLTFAFIVIHNRDKNTLINGSQFNRRSRMSFNISLIIILI